MQKNLVLSLLMLFNVAYGMNDDFSKHFATDKKEDAPFNADKFGQNVGSFFMELKDFFAEVKALNEQKEELKEKNKKLTAENTELSRRLNEEKDRNGNLSASISWFQEKMAEKEGTILALNREISELRGYLEYIRIQGFIPED